MPSPELHHLRIAVHLPCKRCGYDVRGLFADGKCPECGLEILETIAARVDPEIARLPPLKRPRAAAWSLLLLVLALTISVIAAALATISMSLASSPHSGWRGWIAALLPASMVPRFVALAPAGIATAIVAALLLTMAAQRYDWRRILLFFGLGSWLVAACLPPTPSMLGLAGVAAAIALAGLQPIMEDLGRRCRTYRQRAASRQTLGPLESAIAVGVVAVAASEIAGIVSGPDAATPLRLVAVACLAMTVVGFVYLAWNAIWIWRSLVTQPPLLERVIDRSPVVPIES